MENKKIEKTEQQLKMYENIQKHVPSFQTRISILNNHGEGLGVKYHRVIKQRLEKCPLNLVTKQPLVTLVRALSVKGRVQEPDCNSLKREWVETISIENSFKKFCEKPWL